MAAALVPGALVRLQPSHLTELHQVRLRRQVDCTSAQPAAPRYMERAGSLRELSRSLTGSFFLSFFLPGKIAPPWPL